MSVRVKGMLIAFILGYSYQGMVEYFEGDSFAAAVIEMMVGAV